MGHCRGVVTVYDGFDSLKMRSIIIMSSAMMNRFKRFLPAICLMSLLLIPAGCSKSEKGVDVPDDFNSRTTNQKMEYLMENFTPDSVAVFLCEASLGKIHDVRIELQEAQLYAFEHYKEDDLVTFVDASKEYEKKLPLHEKMKLVKMAATEDPDIYSYELGLSYVGLIREEKKDVKQVTDELEAFRRECKYDPEFYKRFIKGFKLALKNDRHRDLDDKIYVAFINYQDSI